MDNNTCIRQAFFTGLPGCDVKPGKPVGLLFCSDDTEMTPSQAGDVLSYFKPMLTAEDPEKRILPVYGMKQVDSGYTEPTEGTLAGYGYSEKLADGTIKETFNFPLQICVAKMLTNFDGFSGRVFILCDNGVLLVERKSNGNYTGIKVDNAGFQMNAPFGDGQNISVVKISLSLGSDKRLAKALWGIKTDLEKEDLPGLIDLTLTQISPLKFSVTTACSGSNLFDSYKNELATAGVWSVINTFSGYAVTVSAVASDAVTKAFTLTIPSVPVNTSLKVSLALPSELEAAGISGYAQSSPIIIKTV